MSFSTPQVEDVSGDGPMRHLINLVDQNFNSIDCQDQSELGRFWYEMYQRVKKEIAKEKNKLSELKQLLV